MSLENEILVGKEIRNVVNYVRNLENWNKLRIPEIEWMEEFWVEVMKSRWFSNVTGGQGFWFWCHETLAVGARDETKWVVEEEHTSILIKG